MNLILAMKYVIRLNKVLDMNGADALSRLPSGKATKPVKSEITYVNFVNEFLHVTHGQVEKEIKKKHLCKVIMYLQSGWPASC